MKQAIKQHWQQAKKAWQEGKIEVALQAYLQILSLTASHHQARYNAAVCYRKLGQFDLAREQLIYLIAAGIQAERIEQQLADLDFLQNNFSAASTRYQRLLTIDTKNFPVLFNLATCYWQQRQLELAEHYYQQAFVIEPTDSDVSYNLGVIALQQNELTTAIAYFSAIIKNETNHFAALVNLGACYVKQQETVQALYYYQRALQIKPNAENVQYMIAALNGDATPNRAPVSYITLLFNDYAHHYEQHMLSQLSYQAPQILQAWLQHNSAATANKRIVDLGCGTGLAGEVLSAYAQELIAVDLANNMLLKAQDKKIYHQFYCEDFLQALLRWQQTIDWIIALDSLLYSGDLQALFAASYQALRVNGLFMFTIELTASHYQLQSNGRFAHSISYIETLATQINFILKAVDEVTLRYQQGVAVRGAWCVLQKA